MIFSWHVHARDVHVQSGVFDKSQWLIAEHFITFSNCRYACSLLYEQKWLKLYIHSKDITRNETDTFFSTSIEY